MLNIYNFSFVIEEVCICNGVGRCSIFFLRSMGFCRLREPAEKIWVGWSYLFLQWLSHKGWNENVFEERVLMNVWMGESFFTQFIWALMGFSRCDFCRPACFCMGWTNDEHQLGIYRLILSHSFTISPTSNTKRRQMCFCKLGSFLFRLCSSPAACFSFWILLNCWNPVFVSVNFSSLW